MPLAKPPGKEREKTNTQNETNFVKIKQTNFVKTKHRLYEKETKKGWTQSQKTKNDRKQKQTGHFAKNTARKQKTDFVKQTDFVKIKQTDFVKTKQTQ